MSADPDHRPIDIDSLRARRRLAVFGNRIEYFTETDSTNIQATRLSGEDCAEGTVVIAEAQSAGRGRLGRHWSSLPLRNLYMSIVLRPQVEMDKVPQIALVSGLATAESISPYISSSTVGIKWPNDVLIGTRKVSGILLETGVPSASTPAVILGIGVNLNLSKEELPEDLQSKATSVLMASGNRVDRLEFTDQILGQLERRYQDWTQGGFASLCDDWQQLSVLSGRKVRIEDPHGGYSGTVEGINADGLLRIREEKGEQILVVAGDVTVLDGYA